MAGEKGSPYREPCGGWAHATRPVLGCCRHQVAADKTVQLQENITTDSETDAPPQPKLTGWFNEDGNLTPPMNGGGTVRALNHYNAPEGEMVDLSVPIKRGFKLAQARRTWHGRFGFGNRDGCDSNFASGEDIGCGSFESVNRTTADQFKYLRQTLTMTCSGSETIHHFSAPGDPGDPYDWTASNTLEDGLITRGYEVDPTTGNLFQVAAVAVWPLTFDLDVVVATDDSPPDVWPWQVTPIPGGSTVNAAQSPGEPMLQDPAAFLAYFGSLNIYCGRIHIEDTPSQSPDEWADGFAALNTNEVVTSSCSCTVTDSNIHISFSRDVSTSGPNQTLESVATIEYDITLSEPNYFEDLYDDIVDMLALWPLNNDTLYPWRTLGEIVGPLVTRHEPSEPRSPDSGSFGLDISGWENDSSHDGAVIGAPNPAGTDDYFDFRRSWTYLGDVVYGRWLDEYNTSTGADVPMTATQWTPEFGSAGGGFGLNICGAYLFQGGGFIGAQKWAEIREQHHSHNYFRPCGADRLKKWIFKGRKNGVEHEADDFIFPAARFIGGRCPIATVVQSAPGEITITLAPYDDNQIALKNGDVITFTGIAGIGSAAVTITPDTYIQDGTPFKISGTLTEVFSSGFAASDSGISYGWYDDQPKGDFLACEWNFNSRDIGENDRLRYKWSYNLQQVDEDLGDCSGALDLTNPAPVRWITHEQSAHIEDGSPPDFGYGGQSPQEHWGLPRAIASYSATAYGSGSGCITYSQCQPTALCFSPNGETFARGLTRGFPAEFLADDRYGSRWQGAFIQRELDPLYLNEVDDAAWVEPRLSVPDGAPALPTGFSLNILSVATMQIAPTGHHIEHEGEGDDEEYIVEWPTLGGRTIMPPRNSDNDPNPINPGHDHTFYLRPPCDQPWLADDGAEVLPW